MHVLQDLQNLQHQPKEKGYYACNTLELLECHLSEQAAPYIIWAQALM